MACETYALFEVGTTNVRLTLAKGEGGEFFYIEKVYSEPIHIDQHIEADGMIKSAKIHEVVGLLKMYKKICNSCNVKKYIAVAAANLTKAKNYRSFIDELGASIDQEFKLFTDADETNAIYTAIANTTNVPKGVIINVSSFSTRVIHYSRRMILDSVTIPYGSVSLFEKAEHMPLVAIDIFKKELEKNAPFLKNLDTEAQIVGVGDVMTSFGKLARKMKKYPIDIENDYVADKQTFVEVFNFISNLDMEKKQKIKGISSHSSRTIMCGLCIIDAVLKHSEAKDIVIASAFRNSGILFNSIVPSTQEKPISDLLSYSLDIIYSMKSLDKNAAIRHYNLSSMLFRQIRVLHKLPRNYSKVLRIASSLYYSGGFINNYHTILSAPILGATHKEIVLAAFSASFKKWEDFNLAEWVKYKDIMADEDLEAVRKIAIILAMSEAFDVRGAGEIDTIVKDISCDVLGDSVILKLITDPDSKAIKNDANAADVEIFYAKKYTKEFGNTFKKALELL
jgi:exopolyphosphatase/guanosine-5'-triphosphate,3'-diphosphate pyrophosphatase